MSDIASRSGRLAFAVVLAVALVACSSGRSPRRVPVEDRGISVLQPGVLAAPLEVKPLAGAENAGKPGYYSVRRGDTVMRIGLETGQAWRDIVRWNGIANPNLIEVGQVLRVAPPAEPVVVEAPAVVAVARPVTSGAVAAGPAGLSAAPDLSASAPGVAMPVPAALPGGEEAIAFIWPSNGSLLAGFDEARNKGLDLAGKPGDSVLAAADGRVVYAGAGLRGYGNLVILKHNNTFLTAYAHNRSLLVKEDQSVRRGQKIAEVGSSDADQAKLHFEIRRLGKPVDPARYLPPR